MILSALAELAKNEGLIADPDYEQKDVTRIIELDKSGALLGIIDARMPDKKGKPRPVRYSVPKTVVRPGTVPKPQFLYDKLEYFFGVVGKDKDVDSSKVNKHIDLAIKLHAQACNETGDLGLAAVLMFLQGQEGRSDRASVLPEDIGANEWFVFRQSGDQELISDRPAVREWWKRRRVETGATNAICLVTGNACVPVDKHDAIKKVPGGSTSGVAIVTFNSPAFESYGFDRNENAPIGRAAAEGYARALNRMLDPAYPDPHNAGQTLPRRNIRVSEDTGVVFWTADTNNEFPDIFEALLSRPDESIVARLLEAPKSGRQPFLQDTKPFYALTLSGGQGRATIRDWYTGSVSEMAGRVNRYFEDLKLHFPFEGPPQPSLKELLRSVVFKGEEKNIPPNLAADFLRAILKGQSLPGTLLHAAVRRCKAEGPMSQGDRGKSNKRHRSHLRMQVIKGVLRRLKDRPELSEVRPMLDEKNTHAAYLLGRLFAALEHLQGAAQGQTNATVGDRFYGAASTAPVTVFGRLLGLSKHHLAKLRKERPGQAVNLDKMITAIMGYLPAEKFPSTFPMEEQGLFAVGYYHQRQALFTKKEEVQAAS